MSIKKSTKTDKNIEVVEPQIVKKSEMVTDAQRIRDIAVTAMLDIQKRDYRATTVHREEKSNEVASDAATFVHFDEELKDGLGNPVELDVKGTISSFDKYLFSNINFAVAFEGLKDWWKFEQKDKNGNIIEIPINLAQIDMLSQKRLNLSLKGAQSEKHIRALRANSGREEELLDKTATWLGMKPRSGL